jgi:PcfJ-like protein
MTSENESEKATALSDLELEEHLASLGLTSVEEYTAWCAQHGFSPRVKKRWLERCRERYYAAQHQIRGRLASKKQESRHPRETLRKIARGELTAENLTQPHLVAICEAFALLEGDAREAFLKLLLRLLNGTKLLATEPVIRRFGTQAGNTFIDALAALAGRHRSWIRPIERWRPGTHNPRRQFSSLARHLLAEYAVPIFMDSVWFEVQTPSAAKHQEWFVLAAGGKSPRQFGLPIEFTKRMVHHFLNASADHTVETALRWSQVLGLGGSVRVAKAVLGSRIATAYKHDEFWVTVIRWLIGHPMLDPRQIGPLIDYIHHQRFEPAPGAAPDEEPEPPEPNFSIKGRTPASLLRRMHGWHTDLRKQPEGDQITWHASGIDGFDWMEGTLVSENLRRWTIQEIVTWRDLRGEGGAMRHCVASYMHSCSTGRTSIWSLGLERNEQRRRRVLTVEVAVDRRVICQARGKANRMPKEKEVNVLRRWAAREGLTLGEHIG